MSDNHKTTSFIVVQIYSAAYLPTDWTTTIALPVAMSSPYVASNHAAMEPATIQPATNPSAPTASVLVQTTTVPTINAIATTPTTDLKTFSKNSRIGLLSIRQKLRSLKAIKH